MVEVTLFVPACFVENSFLFPMAQKLSKAIMNYHSYSRKYSGTLFIACVVMK